MYNLSKWGKRLAKLIAAAGKETRARGSLWQARAQAPPSPGRPPLAESHGRGPRAPGQPPSPPPSRLHFLLLRTKETAGRERKQRIGSGLKRSYTIVDYYCWLIWCEKKILFRLEIYDRLRPSKHAVFTKVCPHVGK